MMKKAVCWMMVFATMISFAACRNETVDPTQVPGVTDEVMQGGGETTSPTDGTEETMWYEGGTGEDIVITMPPSDGGEDVTPPGWENNPFPEQTQPPRATEPPVTEPPATVPPVTVHTHTWTKGTVAATCTQKGQVYRQCWCGTAQILEEIPALGHNYSSKVVPPTETQKGYTQYTCSRCGHSYKGNYTDPIGDTEPTEPGTDITEIDPAELAKAIAKYINQFRAEEGSTQLTYLPGMSQVAQYRSVQLTTNFAHDTDDIREAHGYYKYGMYFDATQYRYSEEYSYYDSDSAEAISRMVFPTTDPLEDIAKDFAASIRNSASHWRYVSSSEYSFTGVGCAQDNSGCWYVCIMVGRVNYG